jgi:hypothetical protein
MVYYIANNERYANVHQFFSIIYNMLYIYCIQYRYFRHYNDIRLDKDLKWRQKLTGDIKCTMAENAEDIARKNEDIQW